MSTRSTSGTSMSGFAKQIDDDLREETRLQDPVTEKPESAPAPTAAPTAWPVGDCPNGGTTAWLVVLGAWCTSFCSFGWVNSIGTFQEFYQSDFLRNYSSERISWIPSLQVFFMFATGPIVGKIYDRSGPRALLLVGTFLHIFGLIMASISKTYYQILLSQGVCSAIGVSLIFQPALAAINGWFSTRRGLAMGILSTGSSLGGVIFPIMVSRLISEIGYGWAMRTSAFMILFLLIIANLTVKSRFPPNPQVVTRNQLATPFTEPAFLALLAGFMLFTFGLFIPINYVVVEAKAEGMRTGLAEYLVSILNAGSLFGRLLTGILADRFGKFNVFIAAGYISGILVLALWLPIHSNMDGARIAFAVLFGFFSGAYVSLIAALVAQISPLKEIGFRVGLVFLFSSAGALTTSPIAGAILSKDNASWTGVKAFAGVFCLVGATCMVATRVIKVGWKLNVIF